MDASPRYRWKHTRPEKGQDYIGFDGDLDIGRIYWDQQTGGRPECWRWSIYSLILPGNLSLLSQCRGYMEGNIREVVTHTEAVYDRMLPLSEGVQLPIAQEVAHYRRRGLPLPWQVHVRKAMCLDGVERFLAQDLHMPPTAKVCGGTCTGMDFYRRHA